MGAQGGLAVHSQRTCSYRRRPRRGRRGPQGLGTEHAQEHKPQLSQTASNGVLQAPGSRTCLVQGQEVALSILPPVSSGACVSQEATTIRRPPCTQQLRATLACSSGTTPVFGTSPPRLPQSRAKRGHACNAAPGCSTDACREQQQDPSTVSGSVPSSRSHVCASVPTAKQIQAWLQGVLTLAVFISSPCSQTFWKAGGMCARH